MTRKPQPGPADSVETEVEDAGKEAENSATHPAPAKEIGGRDGPEPTRYGDWEKNGRCIDF